MLAQEAAPPCTAMRPATSLMGVSSGSSPESSTACVSAREVAK